MLEFSSTKALPYPTSFLFDIVIDVHSYSSFLPWVTQSEIVERTPEGFIADLTVGNTLYKETYRSLVTAEKNKNVTVKAISGPFKILINEWSLEAQDAQKTLVKFWIQFEMTSPFLRIMMSRLMNHISQEIIQAFENRAEHLWNLKEEVTII